MRSRRRTHDDVWHACRNAGKDTQQNDRDEHQADEGHYTPDHVLQRNVGCDVLDDEDVQSDRRMDACIAEYKSLPAGDLPIAAPFRMNNGIDSSVMLAISS